MRIFGGDDLGAGAYATLLAAAAAMWIIAGITFAAITEPSEQDAAVSRDGAIASALRLLKGDPVFRRFILTRGLLLVSALSPPLVVALAAAQADTSFSELGLFIVGAGVASVIGGRLFGDMADRSSRRAMIVGAGAASVIIAVILVLRALSAFEVSVWALLFGYFLLTLAHTGARVGRKTFIVDIATGDTRTAYIAVSNTLMGLVLLLTGAATAVLAQVGIELALGALAILGALAVITSRSLPEA